MAGDGVLEVPLTPGYGNTRVCDAWPQKIWEELRDCESFLVQQEQNTSARLLEGQRAKHALFFVLDFCLSLSPAAVTLSWHGALKCCLRRLRAFCGSQGSTLSAFRPTAFIFLRRLHSSFLQQTLSPFLTPPAGPLAVRVPSSISHSSFEARFG